LDNRYESVRTKQLELAFGLGFGGIQGKSVTVPNPTNPSGDQSTTANAITPEDILPHILVGDFNALSRFDYDDQYWNKLVAQRAENNWDPPKSDLYKFLTEKHGYKDCFPGKRSGDETEAVSTVWSGERIDWVLLSNDFLGANTEVTVTDYQTIPSKASDHLPVKVTLKIVHKLM